MRARLRHPAGLWPVVGNHGSLAQAPSCMAAFQTSRTRRSSCARCKIVCLAREPTPLVGRLARVRCVARFPNSGWLWVGRACGPARAGWTLRCCCSKGGASDMGPQQSKQSSKQASQHNSSELREHLPPASAPQLAAPQVQLRNCSVLATFVPLLTRASAACGEPRSLGLGHQAHHSRPVFKPHSKVVPSLAWDEQFDLATRRARTIAKLCLGNHSLNPTRAGWCLNSRSYCSWWAAGRP